MLPSSLNGPWAKPHTGAILMYHRIRRTVSDPWRLSVSPEHFDQQLKLLARGNVVPLTELPHTPGGIAITFDDGYADNLEIALPLLEKYRLPATVFVATDALRGKEFWWDRAEHSFLGGVRATGAWRNWFDHPLLRRGRSAALGIHLRALSPESLQEALSKMPNVPPADAPACTHHKMLDECQLRKLAQSPLIDIGAHTCSHPCLPRLSEEAQLREVYRSKDLLEKLIGRTIHTFSYPFGAHDDTTVRVVARAGFKLACIVGGGLVGPASDSYRLPRLMVRDIDGRIFGHFFRSWKMLRWLA